MKITVKGYKSISTSTSIDAVGLTILSGANSSGKSSFMQPFLLLKQTIDSNFDTGAILLDGANAKLTDSTEALSFIGGRRSRTFSIKIEEDGGESSVTFKRNNDFGLVVDLAELKESEIPDGLKIRNGMSSDDIENQIPARKNPFRKYFPKEAKNASWKIIRRKCFLHLEFSSEKMKMSPLRMGISPSAPIEHFIKNIIHVPGLRGNPERSYRVADSGDFYPGSFEVYVASIVNKWKSDNKNQKKLDQLKKDLKCLGLASNIETTKLNDTRIEVKVSRHSGADQNDCVNIADVGFGVSQTLPVLVALLAAKPKQYVYIEQPELHLHPKAQHRMAEIICRAVNDGVRVIIETHSSILIRGIQTLVAKKAIPSDKITLNWFNQDKQSGRSIVSAASMDKIGAFGGWPADFDAIVLGADDEYLDAVEESMNAKE